LKYINLTKSGLRVSKLGLGLSHIHSIGRTNDRINLLSHAISLGITHFDTAPTYGDGVSEKSLATLFKKGHCRSSITITTKFGLLASPIIGSLDQFGWPLRVCRSTLSRLGLFEWPKKDYDPNNIRTQVEASLKRLQTDYIDVYCIHEAQVEDLNNPKELLHELLKLKNEGKIRHIGISGQKAIEIYSLFSKKLDFLQTDNSKWTSSSDVPDFTYAVFKNHNQRDFKEVFQKALLMKPNGGIIIGTTKIQHINELVEWTDS
jgi:aryl-alcohol dehydrogenase-like predicted oxidoreductase